MNRSRLGRAALAVSALLAGVVTPGSAAAHDTDEPDAHLDTELVDALISVDMGSQWLDGNDLTPELMLVPLEGEEAQAARAHFISQAAELLEVRALLDLLVDREQEMVERVEQLDGVIADRRERLVERRAELAIVIEALGQAAVERYVMGRSPAPQSTDLADVYELVTDVRLVEAAVDDLIDVKLALDARIAELERQIGGLENDRAEAADGLDLLRGQMSQQGTRLLGLQRSLPEALAAARDARRSTVIPELGLSLVTVEAYLSAERQVAATHPDCRIHWQALAGIGRVESNHGRFKGGSVAADGRVTAVILGPVLDGEAENIAEVVDTDGGALDGNSEFDRAVGPMQFIPQTWQSVGADGNGDGVVDVHNLYDAALSAARYLCNRRSSLDERGPLRRALLSYNQSGVYADTVLSWADDYDDAFHLPSVPPELLPTGLAGSADPPADGTADQELLAAGG